ncbi:MAG: PIG-L deacetylase family protein [Candidatus Limnocylindria bacterium]
MIGRVPGRMRGGLAAILAHPDDESFGSAGALALAHDAGRPTRLLLITRGEAGGPTGAAPEATVRTREDELRCAAGRIGLDEVTSLEGYRDGAVAEAPFDELVRDISGWLERRRPEAVITFGPHGITHHPDHVAVGNATRWAAQRLVRAGIAPAFVYVISPVFGPGQNRYDLSAEEQGATHRIDITDVAERKLTALECHVSQPDLAEPVAELRVAIESGHAIYEGYHRVAPPVRPPHPVFDAALL